MPGCKKAYINDAEVEIRYAISGNEIVLRTTTAGSTGPISLEGPDGTARSAEIFTYTYPTPEITTYPESFTVGDEVVFFGTGLDGILNVRFDTVEGEIVDQRSTELVVKVPDLRIPEADITFSYFDGSSVVSFVHSGAEIVREVPKVDQLTPLRNGRGRHGHHGDGQLPAPGRADQGGRRRGAHREPARERTVADLPHPR